MRQTSISACLVVYNEEKVIERCLASIKDLVDEIIIVHDGECSDQTLAIARKYTNAVLVRPHAGMMEAHLAYAFKQARSEWILRIDADEWIDPADHERINALLAADEQADAYILQWELWNGKRPVWFKGLQKKCFLRRSRYHYCGIPHEAGTVDGRERVVDLVLHHRPTYNNVALGTFLTKAKRWIPIHIRYFFPQLVTYECFQAQPDQWLAYAAGVKQRPVYSLIVLPLKNFFGQLKNGLYTSRYGWMVAFEQYLYYLMIYWNVWRMTKQLR